MKKSMISFGILALSLAISSVSVAAGASATPEPSPSRTAKTSAPTPADYLNQTVVQLNEMERKALKLTTQFARTDLEPYLANGKLIYVHGAGIIPTILASPMQVCDVELEPGETVNEIVTGDSARWLVESGKAGDTMHLFIKPADTGLASSAVITTNRRVYHLRLVSGSGHTPYVGFVYHGTLKRAMTQKKEQENKEKQWQSTTNSDGKDVDLAKLNFNYEVSGSASWKPERVYDDGQKIYIKLPKATASGELPVLLVRKGDKDVMVNYRAKDATTLMVDGIFDTIALVAGVGGDQESIEVRRVK